MDRFTDILQKLKARYPALNRRLAEVDALSRWDKAVGPAISKHTRVIRVQDEVLWVEVDHPIWKSELLFRKNQILKILNQTGGTEATLKDLLFLDARRSG